MRNGRLGVSRPFQSLTFAPTPKRPKMLFRSPRFSLILYLIFFAASASLAQPTITNISHAAAPVGTGSVESDRYK